MRSMDLSSFVTFMCCFTALYKSYEITVYLNGVFKCDCIKQIFTTMPQNSEKMPL